MRGMCSVSGCAKQMARKGLCTSHFYRFTHGIPLDAPWRHERPTICIADGCDRKAGTLSLCTLHYQRKKSGKPFSDPAHGTIERSPGSDGYINLRVPLGTPGSWRRSPNASYSYMLEHRYVMQEFIGRPLATAETVHHRDGNRSNNAIENLELRTGAHGKGITVFDGAEVHIDFLLQYGGLDLEERAMLERIRGKFRSGVLGFVPIKSGRQRSRASTPAIRLLLQQALPDTITPEAEKE